MRSIGSRAWPVERPQFVRAFDQWTDAFAEHVAVKGKVEPGEYRAFGHEAPGHRWADLKRGLRHARMAIGKAPAGSSPRVQHDIGLNQDARIRYRRSEGKKIRD